MGGRSQIAFRWVAVGMPPDDFRRSQMALRWAAVGMPPGCYSAIVADVFLVDHHVGCSSTLIRAACPNSSGSGSLLRRIVGSAFVGGFAPLPVRVFLQICCRSHICGDPCLFVYGHQWVGSFIAAAAVDGNIGFGLGELAMELRSQFHYSSHIEAVFVVARNSARAVVDGSPH